MTETEDARYARAVLEMLTKPQLRTCIETVEGGKASLPNSKAAGVDRVLRGMAKTGNAIGEVLTAAGLSELAAEAVPDEELSEVELAEDRAHEDAPAGSAPDETEEAAADGGPRSGSKERTIFEMMLRSGGATNAEICAAMGYQSSFAANGRRFAKRFGLEFRREREGRTVRFGLRQKAGT